MLTDIDYTADLRKYTPQVNAAALRGIVKHLGIALRFRDSSLVSAQDRSELARVRDGFMKRKLGLVEADVDLDAALSSVLDRMTDEHDKSRVIVYYLLAEKFDKLPLFER